MALTLQLGRVLAQLAPKEPEMQALLALMEIQASRLGARTSRSGGPVLLMNQDWSRWDCLLVRRGLAALEQALSRAAEPYALQAAIVACNGVRHLGSTFIEGFLAVFCLFENVVHVLEDAPGDFAHDGRVIDNQAGHHLGMAPTRLTLALLWLITS